ncbi:MAG: glycoside hydrolase family 130 protein [Niabella sp.]
MSEAVHKYINNPILRPYDIQPSVPGMEVTCVLNPGIFYFDDKIWMLVRVAERPVSEKGLVCVPVINDAGQIEILRFWENDPHLDLSDGRIVIYRNESFLSTLSHLRLLYSNDGVFFTESPDYPSIYGSGPYETYGIEDCRIALINGTYWLTYTAVSALGVGVGMMSTTDWKQFNRRGVILPPHNKDCALFEQKVKGLYYMLHRPSSVFIGGNYIWLASSPDLQHWGSHKCIAKTRPGKWDSERIGAGASPVLTSEGWLVIYHGANDEGRYCLGALLLDKEDPSNVIARSDKPVMIPEADYEKNGFFGNVVFTNGHIVKGDELLLYYGAADEVICLARLSLSAILKSLNI